MNHELKPAIADGADPATAIVTRNVRMSGCRWASWPFRRAAADRRHGYGICCLVGWSVWLLSSLLLGCNDADPTPTLRNPIQTPDAQGSTDLQQGLDFLNRADEFNPAQVNKKILYHFQQWLSKQPSDLDWKPDAFVQNVPERFRSMVAIDSLASTTFESYDCQILQEATWMRDIARWTAQSGVLTPDARAMLGNAPSPELTQALQLFEWTVRNLQLDADVTPGSTHRLNSDVLLYPWEAILLGRGTRDERAQVFTLLARQLNLPVVMLGLHNDPSSPPRTWLPALMLQQQLYLFDMRLGIPVLNQNQQIATLVEVQHAPELLHALEVLPAFPYPVTADDLSHVVAMIDMNPPAFSRRMSLLESALSGTKSLALTSRGSQLAESLAQAPGLTGVIAWPASLETYASRSHLQSNQQALAAFSLEHGLFDQNRTPLLAARASHFRGQLDNTADQAGAATLYLESRLPDDQIQELALQALTGGRKETDPPPPPEEVERNKQLAANINYILRRTKQNASYWLGTMSLDQGKYDVAIEFFQKRVLSGDAVSPWTTGATYNLGRALEALGRVEHDPARLAEALRVYHADQTSPSAAACQWRAQRLEHEQSATEEATPSSAESPK